MSRLNYLSRPLVAFDAQKKDHRRWFFEFQAKKTWGHCPVKFIVPDEDGDLITICQRKLIAYYVSKEFKKIT